MLCGVRTVFPVKLIPVDSHQVHETICNGLFRLVGDLYGPEMLGELVGQLSFVETVFCVDVEVFLVSSQRVDRELRKVDFHLLDIRVIIGVLVVAPFGAG